MCHKGIGFLMTWQEEIGGKFDQEFVLGLLVFFPFILLRCFVPLRSSSPLPFFFYFLCSFLPILVFLFYIWYFLLLCLPFPFPLPFSLSSLFFFELYDSNWFFSLVIRIGLDLKLWNAWDTEIILISMLQYFPKSLHFPLFKKERHFSC